MTGITIETKDAVIEMMTPQTMPRNVRIATVTVIATAKTLMGTRANVRSRCDQTT
jgi:hypothetical protein